MTQLRAITATGAAGGTWTLTASGTGGRVEGSRLELGDRAFTVAPTGSRWALLTATGNPAVRFDPAGRKATTLATATGRYRLARLRGRPLQHRWQLTRDVRSEPVLTVTRSPLGVRVQVTDADGLPAAELEVLALAALAATIGLVDTALLAA